MKVGRKVEECGDESFIIPFIIMGKIFEKNSSFHVKQGTTGKVKFLFIKNFLQVLKKRLILEED